MGRRRQKKELFKERSISFAVNAKRKKGAYLLISWKDRFLFSQGGIE
jgi:hypothetical protein